MVIALGTSVVAASVAMLAFAMTPVAEPLTRSVVGIVRVRTQLVTTDKSLAGRSLAEEHDERPLYHHDENRDEDAPQAYQDEGDAARAHEEHEEREEQEHAEHPHQGEDRSDELRNHVDEGANHLRHELKEHSDDSD
jgi:hypothetical protein